MFAEIEANKHYISHMRNRTCKIAVAGTRNGSIINV